jgi:quinol-cytochrome oxidoreductase complex cytochrome b subunit
MRLTARGFVPSLFYFFLMSTRNFCLEIPTFRGVSFLKHPDPVWIFLPVYDGRQPTGWAAAAVVAAVAAAAVEQP